MTAEEFNALPEEARRFIIAHSGCLGCGGNKEQKLTKAYELYKTHRKMNTYQIKGGGINYVKDEVGGVLYPIHPEDTALEIRKKIEIAKAIHEVKPHIFTIFDEKGMQDVLDALEPVEVVNIDEGKPKQPVRGNGGKFEKKQVDDNDDEI